MGMHDRKVENSFDRLYDLNRDGVLDPVEQGFQLDDMVNETEESEDDDLDVIDDLEEEDNEDEDEESFEIKQGSDTIRWSKFYPDHCEDEIVEEMIAENVMLYDDSALDYYELLDGLSNLYEDANKEKILSDLIIDGYEISSEFLGELFSAESDSEFFRYAMKRYHGDYPKDLIIEFADNWMDEELLSSAILKCDDSFDFDEIETIVENREISEAALKHLLKSTDDDPLVDELEAIMNEVDSDYYYLFKPFINKLSFEDRLEIRDEFF